MRLRFIAHKSTPKKVTRSCLLFIFFQPTYVVVVVVVKIFSCFLLPEIIFQELLVLLIFIFYLSAMTGKVDVAAVVNAK